MSAPEIDSSVDEAIVSERKRAEAPADDSLDARREKWRRQKARQREKSVETSDAGAEIKVQATARKAKVIDPRLLERVSRWIAVVESHGAVALTAGIKSAVDSGYPGLSVEGVELQSLHQTSQLYVEMRSQDLLAWLVANPKIAAWLPEIILGGTCLGLIVPRAISTVRARKLGVHPADLAKQSEPGPSRSDPSEDGSKRGMGPS